MSTLPWMPHLLRPMWLLALLALPALRWLWRQHARTDTPWKKAVDPHLLPGLLQEAPASTRHGAWLFGIGYVLAVLALAGPARQQRVPLYVPQAPLVIVMDLSSHMLVADLPPSRLLRARLKVQQLMALRKGGQVGLVAYAGDAFTVAPLGDDANSMRDLLAALTPDTMPVDGQNADRALRRAIDLLLQAGFAKGQILLLSDTADASAIATAREARAKGFTVEVLGIGTIEGAPLPAPDGTFAQDPDGGMKIARLDVDALRALAQAGGGRYEGLTTSTDDLSALDVLDSQATSTERQIADDSVGWRDEGPFLLLALLPLVALGFRRGWLAVALLAVFVLPNQRAEASETAWKTLWQRSDQRADRALRTGDATTASALAHTPEMRAAAAYRQGDFATAARTWAALGGADEQYNRGNALAQLKQYPAAIAAYQRALQLRPGMDDARANLKLVEQLQKQQKTKKQQQNAQQQKPRQDGKQNPQEDQKPQDQNGQSKNQENMQQSKQPGDQQQRQQQQDKKQQGQKGKGQEQQARQDRGQEKQKQQEQKQQDQSQSAPDEKHQAQADAAERRAMQAAMQRKDARTDQRTPVAVHESTTQREQREAVDALLQRVPDDPGALLRRKFALEYARRQREAGQ